MGSFQTLRRGIPVFSLIFAAGCTQAVLRDDSLRQAHTASQIWTQQVLYNLVAYADYEDHKDFNSIPSFVQLTTGQTEVSQTLTGGVSVQLSNPALMETPSGSGMTQTSEQWLVQPITDPTELKRLRTLYRTQFEDITADEITKDFPAPAPTDTEGRPLLQYTPTTDPTTGLVKLDNRNKPVFEVAPAKTSGGLHKGDIPGAVGLGGSSRWFILDPPVTGEKNTPVVQRYYAGTFRGRKVWITDREAFSKFVMLTIKYSNQTTATTPAGAPSTTANQQLQFIIPNGLLVNPR